METGGAYSAFLETQLTDEAFGSYRASFRTQYNLLFINVSFR